MNINFKEKSSKEILEWFETCEIEAGEIVELEVLESDIERIGYKAFVDLAQVFFMKMLTPTSSDAKSLTLRFQKLNLESSFHKADKSSEKYGVDSEFFTIDKTAQFSFLYHYREALKFINIKDKKRVLNLGVNRGDEFRVIEELLSADEFKEKEFVGIDYSASAIEYAKKDFPSANVDFRCHDINALDELGLGEFDLIISIGTLQSTNINFNTTFMSLYQNHLEKGGAIILGFPNCRWIDGEMIYGAKAPNYAFSELSLVLKDIHFCKKYLQQKKYRVTVTGKDYLFLTARKILH
ncbi:putative methyltransferase, type 12 [Sulfurimonas gotlandica GD1]|uniref:Putative methyltransferase, type 12 n=1 Tax=Sulfurimonas gotlandica (strain DSM 19862 / JCM 16533 / GD1) TaxID=929558 RepID=B6BGG6_SULGG|nr:class I SAM-dependent methyltransferase [Sulfurimonas gotlandica]EDZ63657.1 Methyltransferase domain family protein [Sulfurimonas gotlandica GD1]EHP29594.1 putative methyltransferase, type 12 [Sulfurimonas gotlandica GD1]